LINRGLRYPNTPTYLLYNFTPVRFSLKTDKINSFGEWNVKTSGVPKQYSEISLTLKWAGPIWWFLLLQTFVPNIFWFDLSILWYLSQNLQISNLNWHLTLSVIKKLIIIILTCYQSKFQDINIEFYFVLFNSKSEILKNIKK